MSPKPISSGCVFVVAAPSGAGKSSLVKALLAQEPEVNLSVSYTTRTPRPGEAHGREYFFTNEQDFLLRQSSGEFLESACVHGHYYGTSRITIEEQIAKGKDVLLEIDWQGAQLVRQQFPAAVGIFILPPSMQALKERLINRGQDAQEVITRRLLAAAGEIAHAPEFEYVIINELFETALAELAAIVKASRCRYLQQATKHSSLFAQLGIHTNLK